MNKQISERKVKYENKVFESVNDGKFIIIEYINNRNVIVEFLETKYRTTSQLVNIESGSVRDKLKPSVYGVGIVGDESTVQKRKVYTDYSIWVSMLKRCYSTAYLLEHPSYESCTVSDNFKHFSYFKEWRKDQTGFNSVDEKGRLFNLDKDILVKGNKVYSEDTCCFVPQEINNLFVKNNVLRGENPIGVYYIKEKDRYSAHIVINNKPKTLGGYKTAEEAFQIYKQAKESNIKSLANKWKYQIDHMVYEALLNYKVEITD